MSKFDVLFWIFVSIIAFASAIHAFRAHQDLWAACLLWAAVSATMNSGELARSVKR